MTTLGVYPDNPRRSRHPIVMMFEIESTSFCPSGLAPRWTWWIRGIAGSTRYGVVGTDEQGRGLYLYEYRGDAGPARSALLPANRFNLCGELAKPEATRQLVAALAQLGWDKRLPAHG